MNLSVLQLCVYMYILNSNGQLIVLLVAFCQLPPDSGRCRASMPSWFHDAKKKRCAFFVYGGCGGNANRFSSSKACIKRCVPEDKRGS